MIGDAWLSPIPSMRREGGFFILFEWVVEVPVGWFLVEKELQPLKKKKMGKERRKRPRTRKMRIWEKHWNKRKTKVATDSNIIMILAQEEADTGETMEWLEADERGMR